MQTANDPSVGDSPDASSRPVLEPIERRLLGVLIEKAKTTPENYPLSLNALRTGANQKSNRAPVMQLEDDQVEEALESLRRTRAVAVVQGAGRVDKYRHLAYEWLGVDKVELAVVAELLLRGPQTVGELRGRAARMEPIKDLGELRPVLERLEAKRLVVYLTPPGRGSIVTHALYPERELEKLRRETSPAAAATSAGPPASQPSPVPRDSDRQLEVELGRVREELAELARELTAARAEFQSVTDELRRELGELNRQLGN